MEPKKNTTVKPVAQPPVDEHTKEAYQQAEHDIEQDPDLSIHSKNDDLDEGELARLGGEGEGVL